MNNGYRIIISNKNIYQEIELSPEIQQTQIGTGANCEHRLYQSLFFESFQLTFLKKDDIWTVFCSDNLYLTFGDSRKYATKKLKHGDILSIKYQSSDYLLLELEFVIAYENKVGKYERRIDISGQKQIRIGGGSDSQIILGSQYTREDKLYLERKKEHWELSIVSAMYGVYHNGTKENIGFTVNNIDFFSIGDYTFYYKDGTLWTEKRDDMKVNGLKTEDIISIHNYPKFRRNARIKFVLNEEAIEILDPPNKPEKPKNHLLISLLPSLGMLATVGLMASIGGAMVIFSLISGSIAVITTVMTMIQGNRDYKQSVKERIETYNKYIEKKRNQIIELRKIEKRLLEKKYPDQQEEKLRILLFSNDLFDRQPDDDDFLQIRLGTGEINAVQKIEFKKQERLEIEDELQLLPERLANEFEKLKEAPVVCDIKENAAIGIVGKEEFRFEFIKNVIVDLCARHYSGDIQLFFVSESKNKEKFRWLRFLPYVNQKEINTRNIVCDDESKNRVFDYLYKELSKRAEAKSKENEKWILVFFYDEYDFQRHPISKFVNKLEDLSVSFVFMAEGKSEIPLGCKALIFLDGFEKGYLLDTTNGEKKTEFTYQVIDDFEIEKIAEVLAPIYTEEISLESTLRKNISLFELLDIFTVEDLNLKERWNCSKVYKTMSAPVGITKNGIISLDLHDKAHGPHGLVAGTTGSGKSEILQTYILSMATLYHPYEVVFVIIDFKGGGMVNQFKDLPHLLGAITNIDGKEINRSLKSIKAELQKRQRLFAEAEVNHIDKYIQKYQEEKVDVPIPHLILIVDEFAELKAEQPDFMKELISAARIGRSLGVHLILATQKPSGQVDDQIWSNSRFKLCLKVQNQEESKEVLKSPLAAEIKEPGRAYLQVGNNEIFELFQSAYSGAPEHEVNGGIREFTINEVRDNGKRVPVFIQKSEKRVGINKTQLEAIVEYIGKYCRDEKILQINDICLPPLQETINYPIDMDERDKLIWIGVYDDPDNQIQEIAKMDFDNSNTLIIGSAQSGKTNLLQSIIRTIACKTEPNEAMIYILDFSSMVLKNFEKMNHVGGVVCATEDEKLKNLFKFLFTEISLRKDKLVGVGVSSYTSYVEAGYTDMPHIYILIDNMAALQELYLENDDSLLNIMREGISYGITVIVANNQTAGMGYRYISNFANKIAFHCNDSAEYGNLFERSSLQPENIPGRCIIEIDKQLYECQTYLAFYGEREIERVQEVQKFISGINSKYSDVKAIMIPAIPQILLQKTLEVDFHASIEKTRIPIGVTYNEVEPYYLNLSQLGIMGLCGKENTGHRNFVKYLLQMLEKNKIQQPVKAVIFDDISRKYIELKDMSIVEQYTLDSKDIFDVCTKWHDILQSRYDSLTKNGEDNKVEKLLLMIIQNSDVAKKINDDYELLNLFMDIVNRFRGLNIGVIFTNFANSMVPYDAPEPLRMIKDQRHIIFFENLDNLKPIDLPYDILKDNKKKLETGDAYYLKDDMIIKLKMVKAE